MNQVATLQEPTLEGWFHHGDKILELVEQYKPKVCVELGTFMGASAIPVARSIRRWDGTLTCVDTWTGDIHQPSGAFEQNAPWMLVRCARNIIEAGVSAHVRLIPCLTVEAARAWSGLIDYLYVDADHSCEAVLADLRAWYPRVKRGGLILGDDYGNKAFPGVKEAWDDFATIYGLTLNTYQSTPPHPDGVQLVYATT